MALYFVGHGLDCYRLTPHLAVDAGANGISTQGDAACFAYADMVNSGTGAPQSATSVWTHCVFNPGSGTFDNGRQVFYWYNSSGVAVITAVGDNNGGLNISYWNGTTYVSWGDFPLLSGGIFDFYFNIDASVGELNLYLNQTLVNRAHNINTSGMGNIASFRMGSASGFSSQPVGQVIIASYTTIGHVVRYRRPSGNGSEQQWTGTYTQVSGGNIDDTQSINTTNSGDISNFTSTDFTATPSGSIIKAVALGNRVRAVPGGGPQNIQGVLSIGGTDYFSPSVPIGPGYRGSIAIFENNPVTAAPWASVTPVNNPFGVKATA